MDLEKEARRSRTAKNSEVKRNIRAKNENYVPHKGGAGLSEHNPAKLRNPERYEGTSDVAEIMSNLSWRNEFPKSPDEMVDRFSMYFGACAKSGRAPTVAGLACASGIGIIHLTEIERGNARRGQGFDEVIKQGKAYIHYVNEGLAADGKMPPVAYIFMSKNYFGMADTVEHTVEAKTPLSEIESGEQLQKRIAESVPDEIENVEYEVDE